MKSKNFYFSLILAVAIYFILSSVSFANTGIKGEPPIYAPVLLEPLNGSITSITPNLDWTSVENSTYYKIEVLVQNGPYWDVYYEDISSFPKLNIGALVLRYNTVYHWQVAACNEAGSGPWSQLFSFKTPTPIINNDQINEKKSKMSVNGLEPESAPELLLPINFATNIPQSTDLQWKEVSNATSYKIRIYRKQDGILIFETNSTEPLYFVPEGILDPNAEYKWTVCACNDYGSSEWSYSFIFTTKGTDLTTDETSKNNNYKLNNNYPNPFNPVTKISFNIPKNTLVKIKIYDLTGKEVKVLANNFYNAGLHSVEFNAANLSSGIYIYKMEAGDFKAVKKMMLIK